MKPEIKVKEVKRGDWKVRFNIGVQYFTLEHIEGTTKKEANFMAKQLKIALGNIPK